MAQALVGYGAADVNRNQFGFLRLFDTGGPVKSWLDLFVNVVDAAISAVAVTTRSDVIRESGTHSQPLSPRQQSCAHVARSGARSRERDGTFELDHKNLNNAIRAYAFSLPRVVKYLLLIRRPTLAATSIRTPQPASRT